METKPYTVDEKAIERRANIKPFGLIKEGQEKEFTQHLEKPPIFKTADDFDTDNESESENQAYVYKPTYKPASKQTSADESGIYIAPSRRESPVSIKIINLPLEVDRSMLETIIMNEFKLVPLSTHVVNDRDSGTSRGFAYVSFSSKEKAKEAADTINGHIIEHSILGAEIAKYQ